MGLSEPAQGKAGEKSQLKHPKSTAAVRDVRNPEQLDVGRVLFGDRVVRAGIRARGKIFTIAAANSKQPQNLVTSGV